ncbi:hypothetical protein JV173_00005 [Acholeplasma equirhinis]|uniref:hypothetical protein n=1 Tax=Acholeplasma equirhinis TaxID=555393 RepID=UPI00197AC014|nr:hypothetical protein [Acholeplasma equirhinis]MBN3489884.1 hypothetical protein [Acholeplasma equirhinis]
MAKRHDFNFEGGEILSKIAAWWLVSYKYYLEIDAEHFNWSKNLTDNSINSRKSNYERSTQYHEKWLKEVLKMNQLDKHKNSGNLSGNEIKSMARELIKKLENQ